MATGKVGKSRASVIGDDAGASGLGELLPPRVALESADASVRLAAMARLESSVEKTDDDAMVPWRRRGGC